MATIQAVVKINGINTIYLYDNEIEEALSNFIKWNLKSQGKKIEGKEIETVITKLNILPK